MKLLSEYNHPKITLKNRVVMPPMCMYSCYNHDGIANEFHHTHYGYRAFANVGMIIVEATGVLPEGKITDRCLGLYNDQQMEAFKPIVKHVQSYGSKIGIQLNHAGRKCTAVDGVDTIVAPSAIAYSDAYRTPVAMSDTDIHRVIEAFCQAAQRADQAGFDFIEIHGAHGYLISEFISPITNQRLDRYQDPAVILHDLFAQLAQVWPKEKPILLRISATDYEEDGYDVHRIIELLRPLKKYIDIVHVSSGGITESVPPAYPGYQIEFASAIKRELEIPTIAVGLINSPDLAADVIENGRADLVAIGRGLLKNPHWVLDAAFDRKLNDLIPMQYKRAYR